MAAGVARGHRRVLRSTWRSRRARPQSVTVVNDIAQTIVPLLVAVPSWSLAGRRSTGRLRTSWFLLAAAALSWGLGQAMWTWYEVVLDQEVPYPGLADVGYLGAVPFLLAGVLVFPSRSLRNHGSGPGGARRPHDALHDARSPATAPSSASST